MSKAFQEAKGLVKEYKISDFANYLLRPDPVRLEKRLVGCEVHYIQPSFNNLRENLRKILPEKFRDLAQEREIPPEVWREWESIDVQLKDQGLEAHFKKIDSSLRPYDPIIKKLSELDVKKVAEIIGYCEEPDGNYSPMETGGSIEEKIRFFSGNILKNVRIINNKAYQYSGLFELRGFDFTQYNPDNSHRMLRFLQNGKPKACVVNKKNMVKYVIDDIQLISYLQLLDKAVKTNPFLIDSLEKCMDGGAKAVNLFFNPAPLIDYSKAYLPKVYQDILQEKQMGTIEKNIVINYLKDSQIGIVFNYIPSQGKKLNATITVLHNVDALEPIKNELSDVYKVIRNKSTHTAAGSFYFLDGMTGVQK